LLNNIWYLGRGGLNPKRYWIWKDCQQEAQNAIWTDSRGYYFCNIVAVSPEAQGKGVGRKLFEIVTERADQEGVKCYLESSKSVPNVEIYQKMGFELVRKMECKDEGDVCQVCLSTCVRLVHFTSPVSTLQRRLQSCIYAAVLRLSQ
jgi:ribosomal protein S18 acetylase RimI-like enzyme